MTTDVTEVTMLAPPASEWWQRWAANRAAWWADRPVLAARLARVRAIALWAAIVWFGVLLMWLPELRLSARAYLGCLYVVVVWFLLARTKSLTWSGYMRFFAACIPWSAAIGVVSGVLAVGAELTVRSAGPSMAIAALTEEALKLLPVALVAAAAPRRASRFAVVDWLLLGMASGTAFTLVEEMLRRLNLSTATGFGALDRLMAQVLGDGLPDGWVRFGLDLLPTEHSWNGAGYAGHGAITALIAGCAGLGIAMWRSASTRTTVRQMLWRSAALALPVAALWVAVADHAGRNAQSHTGPTDDAGLPAWLDPSLSTVPWWIRMPWSLLGHGYGRMWILGAVVAAALLIDAYRLILRPASALAAGSPPRWVWSVPRAAGAATRSWPQWLARSLVTFSVALVGVTWVTLRDVGQAVAAAARQAGEPRLAAMRRGVVAVSLQRLTRELTYEAAARTSSPRRARAIAWVACVALLALALIVAPLAAAQIGSTTSELGAWLAGVLEGLGDWWNGLSPAQQIGVGVGVAALVALSGGSLGLAIGASGVATYGLTHAHGAATFVRNPGDATSSYLATTTPVSALTDAGEFVLTFAPGNFAGAAVGRGIRLAAEELALDPAAFIAARRLALADDSGVLNMDAFLRREPVPLGNGSVHAPLDAATEAAEVQRFTSLPEGPPLGGHDLGTQYQAYVNAGAPERVLEAGGREWHLDGFTGQYGAISDQKFANLGRSLYNPVPGTSQERIAQLAVDKVLRSQAAAAQAFDGTGVFEITTNLPEAAAFFESRIHALGLSGYVRLVPFSGG